MDTETVVRTRRALHAVAELVLAGPQYRAGGTIRLRACPGGFATVVEPELRVVGAELVAPGRVLSLERTTCTELGAALGFEVGAPAGLYHDGPGIAPGDAVAVDPPPPAGSRTASRSATPRSAGSSRPRTRSSGPSTSTSG
ncbi:hypothetical protein ACFQ0M_40225 [Kitasatospora aburaviensis]